ncbi:MAG: flagellar FliJ family protein [Oligoflexus sp.]
MIELKNKIKKMKPIIHAKQNQLDQQTLLLNQIRDHKLAALEKLEKYQREYIQGVESLNKARQSPERKGVDVLENSVDYAKSQWYQSLKEVRRTEEKERSQLGQVIKAQQSLKSIEQLKERYEFSLNQAMKKAEQKQLDEVALQNFNRQKIGS